MKERTLITISRQYGSGGKEIAELLAKKMEARCYDRQILYLAAEIWIWTLFWICLTKCRTTAWVPLWKA